MAKQCWKLHKLFLTERLDREGDQVLASLANVSKRVPALATGVDGGASSATALGVLAAVRHTPERLLQKHFLAMEKSATFLRDIVRELVDAVRRLRTYVDEYCGLVDDVHTDEDVAALQLVHQTLEWMENVWHMYERDALRRRLLVADLEFHDHDRLARMHREWATRSEPSFVDDTYVRMGTATLPPLPSFDASTESKTNSNTKTKSKTKSKSKKNAA
ncbi:hypothetical protein ATCC90586_009965 [Pythium insidiosum]|nr:hypothetical protein ATCC90586_009965 [Pythium insidiosum]